MQTPPSPTPRNRQTSCLHTIKATEEPPRQVPEGLQRRLQAARERRGGAPGTRTSTGGLQTRALRPGRTGSGAAVARRTVVPLRALREPGTVIHLPALPLPASGARRTVDRYFIVSAAHRSGPGDPALRQLRNSALRSAYPGGCFLPSPLCPRSCSAH